MDNVRQVMDDPVKSSVMLFLFNKDNVHIDKLEKEVDASRVELPGALDFLESSGLIKRKGDYYRKTKRGLSIGYGLQGYKAAPQTLATLAPEILSPSSFILDIGCQGGYSLSSLRKYSRHLIGIDVDLESLYMAKIQGGGRSNKG